MRHRTFAAILVFGVLCCAVVVAQAQTQPPGAVPLEDTDWRLTSLAGSRVTSPAGADELVIRFDSQARRFEGLGICNKFDGQYMLDDARLRLLGLASTLRACIERMELEQGLMAALSRTSAYRLRAGELELLDAEGRVLARFEAR